MVTVPRARAGRRGGQPARQARRTRRAAVRVADGDAPESRGRRPWRGQPRGRAGAATGRARLDRRRHAFVFGAVGLDDPLHQLVAHHVALVEVHEGDALDLAEDAQRLDQAGRTAVRQVDLGDVAGDDRLAAEADARQEHLHLLGRGVLRLVEDHERVVQRAAAHEGERRDLDGAALEQPLDLLGLEHVVERVVQRPQVRIDLLLQVAGQEAELLARLDRRARQHDAADLLGQQARDRLRHRQVGLAGAGRADAEDDVVLVDGFEVLPLRRRLGHDLRLADARTLP